jgi:hypothetical protein
VTITSPSADVRNLSVASAASTNNVVAQVRNTTGATLTKGTVVYITGATGQISTVSKALANADATSAQTLGMMTDDLPNNSNGNVTIIGLISNIDTSSYTDGAQLYLSPTVAGAVTTTKPYAPNHLVYVGIVEYAHPVNGKIFVKVQNGYELDELHDVAAQSPTNGQTIVYNSSTNLWEKNTVSLTIGVNGTLPILNGGTGQTTANAAFNALAPSQTGNSGRYLTTDGSNTSWAVNPLGTVTSVSGTGTVNGLTLTGTVTTSGSLTLGGTLNLSSPPTIGNTTPNTGAFTTLTTSSTVTLNGGTANGVAYLNGSKVLTTGSALTFDGTNLGLGTSGQILFVDREFNINAASGSTGFSLATGGLARLYMTGNSTAGNITTKGAIPLLFGINESEQMRLTSTGLGIGTSSPSRKLEVNGIFRQTDGTVQSEIASGGGVAYYGTNNNYPVAIQVNAVEQARFTSTGLGIGTSSPVSKLHIESTSAESFQIGYSSTKRARFGTTSSGDLQIYAYDSAGVYRNILLAVDAGTAGGNVGIGTISPSVRLSVATAASTFAATFQGSASTNFVAIGTTSFGASINGYTSGFGAAADLVLQPNGGNLGLGVTPSAWAAPFANGNLELSGGYLVGSASNNVLRLSSNNFYNGSNYIYKTSSQAAGYVQSSGSHQFFTAPSGTAGNAISFSQVMTLDASGFLGVGETSPTSRIHANGTIQARTGATGVQIYGDGGSGYVNSVGANPLIFQVNSTERARIDSSGNLLIGTTSASTTAAGSYFEPSSIGYGRLNMVKAATGTTYALAFYYAGTQIGNIANSTTATAYNTSSDYRLKNTIAPMTGALAKVALLKPCTYKWNADGSDGEGFIAHELAEVVPQCVTGEKDAVDAEGKPQYQGIDTSFLVATLTAALQELNAKFDAYVATHP